MILKDQDKPPIQVTALRLGQVIHDTYGRPHTVTELETQDHYQVFLSPMTRSRWIKISKKYYKL